MEKWYKSVIDMTIKSANKTVEHFSLPAFQQLI